MNYPRPMAATKTKKKKKRATKAERARTLLRGIKRLLREINRKHYRIGHHLNVLADLIALSRSGAATRSARGDI